MSIRSEEKKKILEEIKSKRIDDGEIRNAIGKWISRQEKDLKSLSSDEAILVSSLIDKLYNNLNPQIVKKRLLRMLSTSMGSSGEEEKRKEKIEKIEIKNMSDIDPTIPVFDKKDSINLFILNQRKSSKLRSERQEEIVKQKKINDLLDICEALSSVQSKKIDIEELLREKILQIIDALTMQYGGVSFLAPLNIPNNSSLGADLKDKHWEEIEFLEYVWSTSTSSLVQEMNSFGLSSPKLKKSPLFRQVLLSKKPIFIQGDNVELPDNHFHVESAILIPIVVNKQSVGLLGMANGNFTPIDIEIIFEILPKMWQTIILESVSKASKKQEDIERLKIIEKRVEYSKKLTLGLSNVLKHDANSDDEEGTGENAQSDEEFSLSKSKLLKKKLTDIANFLEEKYGGMVFIGAIKVEMNVNLLRISGTDSSSSTNSESDVEKEVDQEKFMAYVFSNSAELIRKTSMKEERKPNLKSANVMFRIIKSQKPKLFLDTSSFKLPKTHFPMSSVLLVPVVINNETVALCGLSNGKFTALDGEILSDVLATLWFTMLQECFSRLDLKRKEKVSKPITGSYKKNNQAKVNRTYDSVTIVSFQFSSFHEMAKTCVADNLIEFFTYASFKFEHCIKQFGLQKLTTFSDEFIVVGGLSDSFVDHPVSCANFIFSLLEEVNQLNKESDLPEDIMKYFPLKLNIGVSTGSCVGGIIGEIGTERVQYDIFGECLEIARELETQCEAGKILISKSTHDALKLRFECEKDKIVNIQEIGEIETFYLKEKKKFFKMQSE